MTNSRLSVSIPFIALAIAFLWRTFSPLASGQVDPDYWWHIGYGEWIIKHHALPTVDFWSWTAAGTPYRLTQWGGEVVMGLANLLGGTTGTQLLSAILATATIAFSYRTAALYLPNRLAAFSVAFIACSLLMNLPSRPHQFSHLGLAILSWLLASFDVQGRRTALYLLPLLFLAWVNFHGAYAFGLAWLWASAGLVAVDGYVTRDPARLRQKALPLALAALAATFATLINPYGAGAWEYVMEVGQLKSSSTGVVDEWMPTSIKTEAGLHLFALSAGTFVAMAAAHTRPRLATLLGMVLLCGLGWSAARVSLMVDVLMVPFLAQALRFTPMYSLVFEGDAARYDRNLRVAVVAPLLLAVGSLAYATERFDTTSARHLSERLPVNEVAFMKEKGLGQRLLNAPDVGGYVIRNLGVPVSMDTRLDLYGDVPFFEYTLARRGVTGWDAYIRKMNPETLLIERDTALPELLKTAGLYRVVFEGTRYVVMVGAQAHPELPTVPPGKTIWKEVIGSIR